MSKLKFLDYNGLGCVISNILKKIETAVDNVGYLDDDISYEDIVGVYDGGNFNSQVVTQTLDGGTFTDGGE